MICGHAWEKSRRKESIIYKRFRVGGPIGLGFLISIHIVGPWAHSFRFWTARHMMVLSLESLN